jgi:5'-deoxynucleotidase YfbR-like HD superfamily hydrolase
MITDTIYTENSIRTFTGKVFDLKILDPDSICIEDIAHGLANTARFAGQLPKLYSVAQHSFHVAQNASKENQLAALLHDASEAYMGDMPSPFKKLLPDFKEFEDKLMKVIAQKFGFDYPLNSEIKKIDGDFLNLEWNAFVENNDSTFPLYSAEEAEKQFLAMFVFLTE